MKALKKGNTFAGIDIGANSISMTVKAMGKNKKMTELDYLVMPVDIGGETFRSGKVRFETVEQICEILKGFSQVMADYGISYHRVVATSAIQEAENCDYIVDQIFINTGLQTTLIDSADERLLIYKCLDEELPDYAQMKKTGTLVVYIGSGNLQFSVYDKSHLVIGQTFRVGTVRVAKLLSEFETRSQNFVAVMDEYIASQLEPITRLKQWEKIDNIIIVSPESGLSKILPADVTARVSRARFEAVFSGILQRSAQGEPVASLPAMLIAKQLFTLSGAKSLKIPDVRLSGGVVYDLTDKLGDKKRDNLYAQDMLWSARYIARRHKCNEAHYQYVRAIAIEIFNAIAPLHRLTERDRLLMETGVVLHECGKLVSVNHFADFTYHIISSKPLMGITASENEIISWAARCMTTDDFPAENEAFSRLPLAQRMRTAKLIGIMRLANALDVSRRQKITSASCLLAGKTLKLFAQSSQSLSLEEWAFENTTEYFKETLGLSPVLCVEKKGGVLDG